MTEKQEVVAEMQRITKTLKSYQDYFQKLKDENPDKDELWASLCNKAIQQNKNQICYFNQLIEKWSK